MKFNRKAIRPRNNWQDIVQEQGMFYHTIDGQSYWNESVCYELDLELVDEIEDATAELRDMCRTFVRDEIQKGDYVGYNFNDATKTLIEKSWTNQHPNIYGRFDLGIDADLNLKLFEYNADTPTSLLEASVIQWNWKEEVFPEADQFNSIHEKLIARWKMLNIEDPVYFAAMTDAPHEDWGNVHYLLETASLAGLQTSSINLEMIGWNGLDYVDMNDKPIRHLFKLYPWEWLANDQFFDNIRSSSTTFYEPIWKMLLSNKLLLVKLWERHKNHPLLLEAYEDHNSHQQIENDVRIKQWIEKPLLGREGQGVVDFDWFGKNNGPAGLHIIQEKMKVIEFDGIQPVIGSWVIGNYSAGIGIREDKGITTNNSCFVPHVFL